MQLKRDKQLRADMRRRGQQAAQRYSWARSAERYLEVLAEVDGVALPAEDPSTSRCVSSRPPSNRLALDAQERRQRAASCALSWASTVRL